MFHLKSIVSRSAAVATKQQLSKFVPVTILPSRNYADHQIPERLKSVATAKGFHSYSYICILFYLVLEFHSFLLRSFFVFIKICDKNVVQSNARIYIFCASLWCASYHFYLQILVSLIWWSFSSIVVAKLPKINWSRILKVVHWKSVKRRLKVF